MSNLRSTIESLAARFAESVIDALRSASIEEISRITRGAVRGRGRPEAAEAGGARRRGRGGRLPRRSPADIEQMVRNIAGLLGKHPDGLRAEQIRVALDVDAKELPRPLAEGVASGVLTKSGQKRATTYTLGSGGADKPARRRRGRAKRG